MTAIEHTLAETIQQVKQQEEQYQALRTALAPWIETANVWTAQYFGVPIESMIVWRQLRNQLRGEPSGLPDAAARIEKAKQIAQTQNFLHWELVFPEVFFEPDGTPKGAPGFDAIIGNPPYVRQEYIQPIKNFLAAKYKIYQGTADLFLYFYEQGLKLLKPEQRLGFISSGTYMNSNSASEFRHHIHQFASFETFVDFGDIKLFRGVDLATTSTIAIMRRGKPSASFRALFVEEQAPDSLKEALVQSGFDVPAEVTSRDEWRFQSLPLVELFNKVTNGYASLTSFLGGKLYSGLKTGLNEAFIITAEKRDQLIQEHSSSAELIKPMRRGQDLRPWYQMQSGLYLVWTYQGVDIEKYPAIHKYLTAYRADLANRSEAKEGQCAWYELRPCDYYDVFEQPKLLWPDISKYPRFSRNEGYYLGNTAFMIGTASYSLLAILQSRISWFALTQMATAISKRAGLWQYRAIPQFVERLPIPNLKADQDSHLTEYAESITTLSRTRYMLDEAMRGRIAMDLGGNGKLNDKLDTWWRLLTVSELRAEVKKAFKRDIPLAERDDWSKYLTDQRTHHESLTSQIVGLETQMNTVVYAAFDLTPDEIALIEKTTKYRYGEV